MLKADKNISLLLGVGTRVCGAAAIAAIAPIIKSKDEDTAIGVGIIALVGTIFAISYTILRPFLALSDIDYGISKLTTWYLTAAMVGLGLNVCLRDLRTKALKPLISGDYIYLSFHFSLLYCIKMIVYYSKLKVN